jgi:hypothetical protein
VNTQSIASADSSSNAFQYHRWFDGLCIFVGIRRHNDFFLRPSHNLFRILL